MLGLAFLLGGIMGQGLTATAQDASSDVTFATPEDVVLFYMEAVAAGDIPGVVQALAVDEMSDNFDIARYVTRLQAFPFQAPAPSDYPFYTEINRAKFTGELLFQTRNVAYGLLASDPELREARTVMVPPGESSQFVNGFIDDVNPERLTQIQVVMIALPAPDVAQTERGLEVWDGIARVYGADALTERVVLLSFEGDYDYVGFGLLRYGGDWKISGIASSLGGTNSLGIPRPTTVDEFQDLITGD
jgi:hypothetical protein